MLVYTLQHFISTFSVGIFCFPSKSCSKIVEKSYFLYQQTCIDMLQISPSEGYNKKVLKNEHQHSQILIASIVWKHPCEIFPAAWKILNIVRSLCCSHTWYLEWKMLRAAFNKLLRIWNSTSILVLNSCKKFQASHKKIVKRPCKFENRLIPYLVSWLLFAL